MKALSHLLRLSKDEYVLLIVIWDPPTHFMCTYRWMYACTCVFNIMMLEGLLKCSFQLLLFSTPYAERLL